MSFFNRLFGKKNSQQAPVSPPSTQELGLNPEPNDQHIIQKNFVMPSGNVKPLDFIKGNRSSGNSEPSNNQSQTESDTIASVQNAPWRTFSIFISSTFADMQAERDHLKNVVFPRVEEELQKRRIKLEIVDLRWGVDTTSMAQEDEREANVLKVCMDEIKRCRPFFIGLLGDRYDWVPPLERMKTALVGEKHIVPEKGRSVTDLEIEFGVLASQDQLVRSVFYFRDPLPYETFSKKKAAMFCDQYNNELSLAEKQEHKAALEKLKTNISNHFDKLTLGNKVKTYNGDWNAEKEKLTGLETWGDTVYADILNECESHAKDTWDKVPKNWQEHELALLNAFIQQHTHITTTVTNGKPEQVPTFCGRDKLLKELTTHLLSDDSDNWGLVLTGESGSGKSAVFSMVNKMMRERNDCYILAHSAGLSPRAKSVAELLIIWNRQLGTFVGLKEEVMDEKISDDELSFQMHGQPDMPKTSPVEKLQEKFLELLHTVSTKKRVLLLIDALDRFEPTQRAQHMSWLPAAMPKNVRLLCTAITGTEQKATQYHKGLTSKSIEIFSPEEVQKMLNALCKRNHKTLAEKVKTIILEKKRKDGYLAISSPLWLSLAANMLMALDQDDFEKISKLEARGAEQIESYLAHMANDFSPLPGDLFISLIQKAGDVFGTSLTKGVFDFIAISRNGLREKDLEKLLEDKDWDALTFANLRRWFKAHLVLPSDESQWNLAHSILRSALIQNIEEAQHLKLHSSIAEYLLILHNDPLKASETIYHLLNANKQKEAALYYSSDLNDEETDGATIILTEIATTDARGLELVSDLPGLVLKEFQCFPKILKRFVYELDNSLDVEGNLTERLNLHQKLKENIENTPIGLNGESFHNAAVLYGKLGDIHQSMGHLKEALNYFDDEVKLLKQNYKVNPQDESLKHNLAVSYGAIGNQRQSMGQMEEALEYFKQYLQLSKELLGTNPLDELVKQNLTASYKNLGDIHQSMGHMEDALKYFDDEVKLLKELFKANPLNVELKQLLSISYEKLGLIHQELGHLDNAIQYFDGEVRLLKELYLTHKQRELILNKLALSFWKMGEMYGLKGALNDALFCYDACLGYVLELTKINPNSESNINYLANGYSKIGEILQALEKQDDAFEYFEKRLKIFQEIYNINSSNEGYKEGLVTTYGQLAELHENKGNLNESLKNYLTANELLSELNKTYPESVNIL